MHYRGYIRTVDSERWEPILLGSQPKQFAMYSDAVEAVETAKQSRYHRGRLIYETMIVSVDQLILKTDDGEQLVTLMELC